MKILFPAPAALPTLNPGRMEELSSETPSIHCLFLMGRVSLAPSASSPTIPLPSVPPLGLNPGYILESSSGAARILWDTRAPPGQLNLNLSGRALISVF